MLVIFVVQGFFLSVVNLIILATILFHQVLRTRKEFIIMAALALADSLGGLGCISDGVYRLALTFQEKPDQLRSGWQCFLSPQNQFYYWADMSGSFMLLAVSCDRLLAVGIPFKYFSFTVRYGLLWAGSAYGFTAMCILVAAVLSYQHQTPLYPATCPYVFGLDPTYYKFDAYFRIFGGIGSVLVYVMVLVLYKKKQTTVVPGQVNSQRESQEMKIEAKIQWKLTKTLGISSAFTLAFYVLPLTVEQVVLEFNLWQDENTIITFLTGLYVMVNINLTANYFIYTLRHKEIKKAVIFMFKWKQMSFAEFKRTTQRPKKNRTGTNHGR